MPEKKKTLGVVTKKPPDRKTMTAQKKQVNIQPDISCEEEENLHKKSGVFLFGKTTQKKWEITHKNNNLQK